MKKDPFKVIEEEVIDIGNTVVCDICNEDYTNSDESGGFLFGSYGYCPKCAVEGIKTIRECNEEKYISVWCPESLSFKDFILGIRGGNNTIRIQTLE